MFAPLLLAAATLIAAPQSGPAPKRPSPAPKTAAPAPKAVARSNAPANAEFDKLAKEAAAARDAGRIDESIALYQRAVKL
jgi:hypothetical protein